jgi:hypothetical protein
VITTTTTLALLSTMSIVDLVSIMRVIVVKADAAATEMLATDQIRPNFHIAVIPAIRSRKNRDVGCHKINPSTRHL